MVAKNRPSQSRSRSHRPVLPPRRDPPRKSLKQSLKDVFLGKRRKPSNPAVETVGSGILRKATPSTSFFPSTATLSSFPVMTGSQFSLDEYTISRSIPNRFQTPTRRSSEKPSVRQSLLPATSLSQFNLHHAYLQKSSVPQRAVHEAISPCFSPVVSQQASVATLTTVSSPSTLRLQESRQSLARQPSPRALSSPYPRQNVQPSNDQKDQISWLQSPTASSVSVSPRNQPRIDETVPETEDPTGVRLVEHFKSFCILDTAISGCPVVATSQELRYIFEIGEHFFLNSHECEGTSMDIVTGQDAAGDPITHLVLFTPLVIPSSGRSRFMLASLIDVTRFIHDTASLPALEKESDASTIESDLQTPKQDQLASHWTPRTQTLSVDDLLGGCMLPDDRQILTKPSTDTPEDIWLNLANEEKSKTSTTTNTPRSTPKINQTSRSSNASYTSTTSSTVDEVLDEFVSGLQELYSDFFLLGKSPLDDTYFEICNVSPMLYATKDYIHGHLSRTSQQVIVDLSARLAQGSPFDLPVRWGPQGVDKRLYCTPMYTTNSITWICFLVDHQLPPLW